MAQEIQEYLFSKTSSPSDVNGGDGWTVSAAKAWLEEHDAKQTGPVDDKPTKKFYHFPQFSSERCVADSYKVLTENFPKGIQATSCEVTEDGRAAVRMKELRSFPNDAEHEVRIEGTSAEPQIVGYAVPFDQETELYPGYREVVRRGAFLDSIARDDVLGLFEHREDRLLARSSAGTLELAEDDYGLRYRMHPRVATWIREDVLEPIRRRELRGSSFGFYPVRDEIVRDEDGRGELRELLEVKLIDVSPVARPAYAGSEVALRSQAGDLPAFLLALRRQGFDDARIRAAVEAGIAGLPAFEARGREKPAGDAKSPAREYYEELRQKLGQAPT